MVCGFFGTPYIYVWEIDTFLIKSDIFGDFPNLKIFLMKLSCYPDNYFTYFLFGKYIGFVSKERVSACTYFLVLVNDHDHLYIVLSYSLIYNQYI
jgi:hypothetical protein